MTRMGPVARSGSGTLSNASPVPSAACCSTQVAAPPSRSRTAGSPWAMTTAGALPVAARTASTTYRMSGRPPSGWRTLGRALRIRLPCPAARITAWGPSPMYSRVYGLPGAGLQGGVRTMEAMQASTLDIEGPVYVADFGGDGPVMLLVHGLGGAHLNWMAVAPQLAAQHRVFALDLPGFGRSPLAGRRSTIAANVDLLTRAITRLSRGPIVLMGNSMGGLLSIGAAALHPSLIDALVLVDPAVPAPGSGLRPRLDRVSRTFIATAFMPRWGAKRLSRAVAVLGPESLVRETMRLVSGDPTRIEPTVIDAHIALEAERLAESSWHESFYAATRSLVAALALKRKVLRWVQEVVAPTLLLQGDRDRLVPVASARNIASLRPNGRIHGQRSAAQNRPRTASPRTWHKRQLKGSSCRRF